MHPPFYTPDTYVSSDIIADHHRPVKPRRGAAPQRLRFLPVPGWPPIHPTMADPVQPAPPALPSGRPAQPLPHLSVVPTPRNTLRDMVGRFLIRTGQRMILQN